jgi:MFS family permease
MIFPCVATGFFVVAAAEWRAGRGQRRVLPGPGTARAPLAGVALLLGAIAALGAFQEAAPQNWAAIFMETVRGSGPVLAGLAPATFTLGLAVGRLVAHVIEDSVPALTAVRGAACLAIAGFAALALPLPEGAVLAVFLLAGMGVGPIEPAVFRAVAHRTDPAMRGRSLATVTSVAYMGYLLSPPILGGVAGGFGWGALWAVAAVAAATVVGLSFVLRRA